MAQFHFAIPRWGNTSPSQAQEHIAKTFGIVGEVKFARSERAFDLYYIKCDAGLLPRSAA